MANYEDIKLQKINYQSDGNELEGLLFTPEGEGKFPLVVLIHGHNHLGAWESVFTGYLLQKAGFAAFLPTMLGYGITKHSPDFCGPKTTQGIADGIEEVKKLDIINTEKIGLWGISRGAIVASLVAVKYPSLIQALVLEAGAYDIKKDFEWEKKIRGIKDNMLKETDGTDAAWEERSSINMMDKLEAPTLILHGERDETIDVEQAKMLDKKLTELNKEHETILVPDAGHFITRQTRRDHTFPFFKKHLI